MGSGQEGMSYMQAAKQQMFMIAPQGETLVKLMTIKQLHRDFLVSPHALKQGVSNLERMV